MLAAAASASRHLIQRDASSIGACSGSGNRVRSLLTVSVIGTAYPIRTKTCYSHGYGIGFNAPKQRGSPGLLFAVKGFISDSSNSVSPNGRVPRPYLPHSVSSITYFFLWVKT